MVNELTENEKVAFLLGAFLGVVGGMTLSMAVYFGGNSIYDTAKVYKAENGRSVMRLYRDGRDQILVGDESGTNYKRLGLYLKEVQDANDRKVEQARIEKLVRWED
ncbi:MAG: hypothetical protein AABX39_01960 [Nanoarchaeota archaeon]